MESTKSVFTTIISPILPFMDQAFFQNLFESDSISFSEILIIPGENHWPKYSVISFLSESDMDIFLKRYKDTKYPYLNFSFSFVDKIDSDKLADDTELLDQKIIKFGVKYDRLIDDCYEISCNFAGLVFIDKELLEKQSKLIGYIIKKIGSNLLKGRSIMSISLPVNIFDKRTLLQITAYEFSFAPIIISRAYYSTDPIEKLKWVTIFLISQLHITPIQTKPFNPIIGETFQCKIGNLNYYAELTYHKIPTWNFYSIDDEKRFKIYGYIQTDASSGINSCKIIKRGTIKVDFLDGNVYEIFFPRIEVSGLTMGKRIFNFTKEAVVTNTKENLACHIFFNPDEKGSISSFFSSKQKTTPNTIRGNIIAASDISFVKDNRFLRKKETQILSSVEGEWTHFLKFDDVVYWKSKNIPLAPLYKMDYIIPSDSTQREDLRNFINGNETEAQVIKEKYEDIQRNDRKLRENYEKELAKKK